MSEEMTLFAKTEETDYVEADVQDSSSEKYLLFLSNGICYGVNADIVKEIITEITITHLPMLPKHLSGVYNLRGLNIHCDFRLCSTRSPPGALHRRSRHRGTRFCSRTRRRMVDIEKTH